MSAELFLENLSMMTARGEWDAVEYYLDLLKLCESPIEEMLLAALAPAVMCNERPFGVAYWPVSYEIYPQHVVGPYRADFALIYNRGKTAFMRACLNEMPGTIRFIIECDGHDFHEKTKEQAARDKARDRYFTINGWHVLRFTGSEIHADAIACANQVIDAVETYWQAREKA
jgi:Protein of unknown function (DUF559)